MNSDVLIVPPFGGQDWPTLGPAVVDFIRKNLVHGPGDLFGEPAVVDEEKVGLIYRMYEVYPKGHELAGRRRFKRVGLSLRKGSSKALALDTPIPTPYGWTTMGEIREGDSVFDETGRPCRVVATSDVFTDHQCFAVRFRDGSEIIADAGHLWYTEELRNRPYQGSVKTTAQLAETVSVRADGARNHRIPVTQPLQLPPAELPVDPWIFGMWLGDGRTDDSEFTMAAADFDHFRSRVEARGYHIAQPKIDRRTGAYSVRVSTTPVRAGTHTGDTLKGRLRAMGVIGRKHVPRQYLRGSVEQRLALLQGLMDSDGTIGRDGIGVAFTSTLRCLADAVYELAVSLGMKPSQRRIHTTLKIAKKPTKPAWRVYFHAPAEVPVFSIPRKLGRQVPRDTTSTAMSSNRHIVAVEEVPSVPTRCIAVDSPSHLYLAGRAMIPTHNTELAAWIAACELHPEAPVRCVGWTAGGEPIGGGVRDPYIPLVAYTREQSSDLAYASLMAVLSEGPLADDFDIALARILRRGGPGKAVPVANAPNARDGARTTFQVADETHRLVLPAQKAAHQTMLANIPKRFMADAWTLEVTTAFEPGQNSVAEDTMEYARQIDQGRIEDPKLFFFHRQASDRHKTLETRAQIKAAVLEASGPVAAWSDIESIVDLFFDPTRDRAFLERVWLNRPIQQSRKAFDVDSWKRLKVEGYRPSTRYEPPAHVQGGESQLPRRGALITIGFDGARFFDSTALVGCEVESGHLFVLGLWEQPPRAKTLREGEERWEVPVAEVDAVLDQAFSDYRVWRVYADPPHWQGTIDAWIAKHGEERVIHWWTNREKAMAHAVREFKDAMDAGEVQHDGDPGLENHIGNACRHDLRMRDEKGEALFRLEKERPDSVFKIDAAMAAILAHQARGDAIKEGAHLEEEPEYQVMFVGRGNGVATNGRAVG